MPPTRLLRSSLYPCAWDATHVVVVTEGAKIDGAVEVLESWKGDLRPGDRLTVPELAAFAPEKARVVAKRLFEDAAPKTAVVTGSRMVHFLIRGPAGGPVWLPAALMWKEMWVSVAWVEAGRVYAFTQQVNPGPSELIDQNQNECGLKCLADDTVAAHATLAAAVRRGDPAWLAAAIPPLLRSEVDSVPNRVVWDLGDAGPVALPALRGILRDGAFLEHHDVAVRSLGKAGGAAVGPDLTGVVREELAFWKATGPGLKRGWWGGTGVEWKEVERVRNHYSRVHAAVVTLRTIRYARCREDVTALRDFWQSLPQLSGEVVQLTQVCDKLLDALR